MHNILWCCNTEKGFRVLKSVLKHHSDFISLVCSYHEKNVLEDFGAKIREYCLEKNLPFVFWKDLKKNFTKCIENYNLTGIIAISWQYIIPIELNDLLLDKIIIFHDSLLPKYRGFCPVSTAIIKGKDELGISVLYATKEFDEGDIILQKRCKIDNTTYIKDAIRIIGDLYCEAALELIGMIRDNKINTKKQDNSLATYSIWRNPEDCKINWNESAKQIYNLIRAVSYPYLGAYTILNGEKIRIWGAIVYNKDIKFEIRDLGKIWRLEEGKPVVVCKAGLLKIIKATYDDGKNALPIKRLRQKFE
jgi:methionyl-tRNA formyltransferase